MSLLDQTVEEIYPPRWMNAALLNNATQIMVIESVSEEQVRDPQNRTKFNSKLCVWFEGWQQGLLPNKTQARAIADALGRRTPREWVGFAIALSPAIAPNKKPTIAVDVAMATHAQLKELHSVGAQKFGEAWRDSCAAYSQEYSEGRTANSKQLYYHEAAWLIADLTKGDEATAEPADAPLQVADMEAALDRQFEQL